MKYSAVLLRQPNFLSSGESLTFTVFPSDLNHLRQPLDHTAFLPELWCLDNERTCFDGLPLIARVK